MEKCDEPVNRQVTSEVGVAPPLHKFVINNNKLRFCDKKPSIKLRICSFRIRN